MYVANAENAGAIFCQRKVSKRNPPDAAYFLRSVGFIGVCWKGLLSLQQSAAFLPHPLCPLGASGYSR